MLTQSLFLSFSLSPLWLDRSVRLCDVPYTVWCSMQAQSNGKYVIIIMLTTCAVIIYDYMSREPKGRRCPPSLGHVADISFVDHDMKCDIMSSALCRRSKICNQRVDQSREHGRIRAPKLHTFHLAFHSHVDTLIFPSTTTDTVACALVLWLLTNLFTSMCENIGEHWAGYLKPDLSSMARSRAYGDGFFAEIQFWCHLLFVASAWCAFFTLRCTLLENVFVFISTKPEINLIEFQRKFSSPRIITPEARVVFN